MFVGRPYCRWLCPYGGILAILSRVAWKNVRITPDKELDCGMCAESCPYGAIHDLRADRALCLACTRCYASCPRQKRWEALRRAGPRKPVPATAVPRRWEAVARTWVGMIAAAALLTSVVWLLATYVQAQRVYASEKALVETLKEEAKTDAEVQKTLQPELDRQHREAVARRAVYDRSGILLIFSWALLILWLNYLRPGHGAGAGAPAWILRMLEKPRDSGKRKPLKRPQVPEKQTGSSGTFQS
jgi:NAD-dependent dihydropyrimidine dehydrogenase PreA subunit